MLEAAFDVWLPDHEKISMWVCLKMGYIPVHPKSTHFDIFYNTIYNN